MMGSSSSGGVGGSGRSSCACVCGYELVSEVLFRLWRTF